jgi:hypothetical protein
MQKSHKGFAVLEALLVFVILAIIGGTGYFVWHGRQETNKTLESSQKAADSAPKITRITNFDECVAAGNPVMESYPEQCRANGKTFTKDVTKDWKQFTSRSGKYSLKYPSTWSQATHPEACSEGLLLLGGNKDSVGVCAADGARALGQMTIAEFAKDTATACCDTYQGWKITSDAAIQVDGYVAKKTTAVYQKNDVSEGGWDIGVKRAEYCFAAKETQFEITYIQWSDYPDVLNDFNVMVTKTFTVK